MVGSLSEDRRQLAMEDHARLLHPGNRYGNIWFRCGDDPGDSLRRVDQFAEHVLPQELAGRRQVLISPNEFRELVVEQLRSLTCCYVDLVRLSDASIALEILDQASVPRPSIVVRSGGDFQFYWLLARAGKKAQPSWERIQARLRDLLKAFQRDEDSSRRSTADCAALLPLVGSETNDGSEVEGVLYDERRYSLRELEKLMGIPRPRGVSKSLGRSKLDKLIERGERLARMPIPPDPSLFKDSGEPMKPVYGRRLAQRFYLHWKRVELDLITLAIGPIPTTMQYELLYAWIRCQAWLKHPNRLWREAIVFTREHMHKFEAEIGNSLNSVIRRARRSARGETITWLGKPKDPRFNPSGVTLFSSLHPMMEFHPGKNFLEIIPPETWAERKRAVQQRKNEERKRKRQKAGGRKRYLEQVGADMQKMSRNAAELRKQGLSQRQIAAKLKCSPATVSRALKRI